MQFTKLLTERISTEERKKRIVKIASEEIREAKEQLSVRAETTIEDLERRSMLSLSYLGSIFERDRQEKAWRRAREIQVRLNKNLPAPRFKPTTF